MTALVACSNSTQVDYRGATYELPCGGTVTGGHCNTCGTPAAIRTETAHELLCRGSGITPTQLNEQQRRIGRCLWHLAGFIAGIALGCWMCGHAWFGLAWLTIAAGTAVFVTVARGEFDPVTGQRVHRAAEERKH